MRMSSPNFLPGKSAGVVHPAQHIVAGHVAGSVCARGSALGSCRLQRSLSARWRCGEALLLPPGCGSVSAPKQSRYDPHQAISIKLQEGESMGCHRRQSSTRSIIATT